MNNWLIFLTGLTSGGVTCAAMQGGMLASVIANQKKTEVVKGIKSNVLVPVSAFLATKLISHILLGGLLGSLGSVVELSQSAKLFFQGFAAFFMLATALNLLDFHPIFRYVAFQPPKWVYRLLKNNEQQASLFAPSILGFLTIFIPCGVTQAIEVVAVTSGNFVSGALTLGSFILGTVPIFIIIGLATAKSSEQWRTNFSYVAATILIFMSLYSINGILTVSDSPYALQRIISVIRTPIIGTSPLTVEDGIQKVAINITSNGYSPARFSVKVGMPVELTVNAGEVYSCATAFTFKAFGISANVKPNTNQVFQFTPDKKGSFTFSCSMGMYSGVMEVI